ncbi:MAG: [FeFe] hydrogenase H-cluster radical SAM maturase HydE [Candidatus Omnitrophica bacterium]|nr:[FeFe] hydrogenase H-cluster radical SAM maturase HydE [Candidatus Omnitrophota bacterium]MCM8798547.1 [FeFe] hydrogenase H-cluster radical SAM maturase HydE [Candidatus Omnitrophota bacterium]
MCYAIPGKVIGIDDDLVTVEYFGERKQAKNDFFDLRLGEYVYAQGGFVIQKISEEEALSILDAWKELFFKLQEIDSRLSAKPENLYQQANYLRQKYFGNSCCVHGIIEFSNYCRNDCLYCGLRKSNGKLKRYRMGIEEIIETADYAVNRLGFKALVFQSGEDPWYDTEKICELIRMIRKKCACLIILSIGEREERLYQEAYKAGARGVLLRFETSNPLWYEKFRPGHIWEERVELIRKLNSLGYLIMTGFLIGLPGQRKEDVEKDIDLTATLNPEMFSFGPFIPHPDTPLGTSLKPSLEWILEIIARTRIKYPYSRILVTTALETLDRRNGLRLGLLSGANSLMINLTPEKYRLLYEIYPERAGLDLTVEERINSVIKLLQSLGRAPTDLGRGG